MCHVVYVYSRVKIPEKMFLFISAQFFDAFTANKRFFGGGGGKGGGGGGLGGGLGGLFGGGGAGGGSGYGAPQKPSYGAPTNKPSYGAPTNKPSYGGGGTGFKNIQLPVPGQFIYYISITLIENLNSLARKYICNLYFNFQISISQILLSLRLGSYVPKAVSHQAYCMPRLVF